jgi:Fe-S-cluster-containing dehydrogenase component
MSTDDTTNPDEPKHPYETDDSFHPLGAEWEDQMREQLEDTDYDADLGMQMARDAQRMVAGEISEEEFYAEYHEDVEEEFDMDARPIFDDLDNVDVDEFEDESMLESLADVDLSADDVSRRSMLKKMGAGGLFMGYAAYASYDQQQDDEIPEQVSGVRPADEDEREHRWGMVIDLERCDHCLACVSGCISENGTSTGANWMYVFAYEDGQTDETQFLVRPCQHCSNAPCAKVCPVRARHTREKDGLVLTNYEVCIGCRYCQVACPYGVNYFQWGEPDVEMGRLEYADKTPSELRNMDADERQDVLQDANDHVYDERGWWVDSRPPMGTMGKCTMCPSRQDEHTDNPKGTVACQDACDESGMSAIHFGDLDAEAGELDDDLSETEKRRLLRPQRYLEQRQEKARTGGANRFDAEFEVRDADAEGDFTDPSSPQRDAFTIADTSLARGYYTLYLAERDAGSSGSWQRFDSENVIVAENSIQDSGSFEGSIGSFGGLPSASIEVLYTDDTNEVPATVEYTGDADSVDATVSLVLDEDGETIASQEMTLSGEKSVTFQIDSDAINSDDGVHVLTLVVDSSDADGPRAVTRRGVYVATGGPNVETPEAPFNAVGRDGSLDSVPEIIFKDREQSVEATVSYPENTKDLDERAPPEKDIGLVLAGGTNQDVVGQKTQVYDHRYMSNTAWSGKISTFKLLDDLGTSPNITYIGDQPGEEAKPVKPKNLEGPATYDQISEKNEWNVEVVDKRLHHLEYGAKANRSYGGDPGSDHGGGE